MHTAGGGVQMISSNLPLHTGPWQYCCTSAFPAAISSAAGSKQAQQGHQCRASGGRPEEEVAGHGQGRTPHRLLLFNVPHFVRAAGHTAAPHHSA